MLITPAHRQAYAIEVRMQAILETLDQDGTYWPWLDDQVRAQAHRELGIPMPFNPQEHLIQLPKRVKDKKTGEWIVIDEDYLEVRWRLVWFRDRFPHGTIVTEEVCVDLDRVVSIAVREYGKTTTKTGTGYARYKATVTDGEGGVSTGYGTENAAEFADFVERSETRALGRALAGLGIGTQFIGQEMTELDYVADDTVKVTGQADPQPAPAGSPDDPYLTRLEEQKEMQAAKVTDSPVVGSARPGHASTAAQASAGLGASGMPSPKTTPITSEKPPLLNTAELRAAINAEFKRLADHYTTVAICTKGWGPRVTNLDHVKTLGDASLRTGLKKLQAIKTEQPPAVPIPAGVGATSPPEASSSASGRPLRYNAERDAIEVAPEEVSQAVPQSDSHPTMTDDGGSDEEDIPNFPQPNGNTQEGPQVAPGSTQSVGPSLGEGEGSNGRPKRSCAAVQEGTGITCVREVREDGTHEGKHYFDPGRPEARAVKLPAREQVIVVPDPDTGVRYISTSDGMTLREFCRQHDLMEFFAAAVSKNPRNVHGNVMITERQYWQMRAFAEAQVSMGASEVPA